VPQSLSHKRNQQRINDYELGNSLAGPRRPCCVSVAYHRFIDSDAEFIFVPKSQVEQVVKETGAIPYDATSVELGYKEAKCSFESIIEKYGLTDPALPRLAKIVQAADVATDLHTFEISPGLEAIAVGYSLRLPDDTENLSRQCDVYDAL